MHRPGPHPEVIAILLMILALVVGDLPRDGFCLR